MITAEILQQLANLVGTEYVSTANEIITENSQDALRQVFPCEAVVFPRTAEEIAAIMKLANEHRFYVTARGGGVGYVGSAVPIRGGLVLSRIMNYNKPSKRKDYFIRLILRVGKNRSSAGTLRSMPAARAV